MAPNLHCYHSSPPFISLHSYPLVLRSHAPYPTSKHCSNSLKFLSIRCSANSNNQLTLRTCRNCKSQFDPSLNHPRACRFHTAHFGVFKLWAWFFKTLVKGRQQNKKFRGGRDPVTTSIQHKESGRYMNSPQTMIICFSLSVEIDCENSVKPSESLKVYTWEEQWTLQTLAKFFNTGIAVGLRILSIQDVLLLHTHHMTMTNNVNQQSFLHFPSFVQDS
uniref:Uncharacterized protein n=1 Tax=Cucumis melo TaxID=3656 RepID=A0A9I9DL93_CUCME